MRLRFPMVLFVALLIPVTTMSSAPATPYDELFTADTMRVDYFHSGGPAGESIAVERIVNDGPWAGSRTRLVDDSNLGTYLFEVVDRRTNQVIYSRGFASIFAEWMTTPEAKLGPGTFHESIRFPWPSTRSPGRPEEAGRAQRVPRMLVHGHRPIVAGGQSWPAGAPGEGLDGLRERTVGHQGRSAVARRRVYGRRTAEIPRRREAAGRRDVCRGAVQEPAQRLQRPGHRPACGPERREQSADRRRAADSPRRDLQRVRQRTVRDEPGQPGLARRRGRGAVRRGGSAHQQPLLRRRRHLQRSRDGGRGYGLGRVHLRPRVRPPLRRPRRRVPTRRTSPTKLAARRSSRGSRTSRPCTTRPV